jgi:hypothetical protein
MTKKPTVESVLIEQAMTKKGKGRSLTCFDGYGLSFFNHLWRKYKKSKTCYRCGISKPIKKGV